MTEDVLEKSEVAEDLECKVERLGASTIEHFFVTVSSKASWQNTRISLSKDELLNIQYISGQWNGDGGRYPYHGPEGPTQDAYIAPAHYPVPGEVEDSLVGKIGGHKFLVGRTLRMRVGEPGMLELTINDTGYYDNNGAIKMRISVERP